MERTFPDGAVLVFGGSGWIGQAVGDAVRQGPVRQGPVRQGPVRQGPVRVCAGCVFVVLFP